MGFLLSLEEGPSSSEHCLQSSQPPVIVLLGRQHLSESRSGREGGRERGRERVREGERKSEKNGKIRL